MARAELLDDAAALQRLSGAWDALAQAERLPYCSPAWQLAWWRHAAPPGALLRAVAAWEGDRLVGIAPFFAVRAVPMTWRYAPLASPISSRVEPLAMVSERAEVACAIAETLSGADPRPSVIELPQARSDSCWPGLLGAAWPGGVLRRHAWPRVTAPTVTLAAADLDEWLSSRSANFRSQIRGSRRKLAKAGGAVRVSAGTEELQRDLAEFERLHLARWGERGGSTAIGRGTSRMLADAGGELMGSGRLQLASVEVDGRVISSLLFVAAGGEVSFWNGGFDEEYASLRPSLINLVEAVSRGLERGDTRLDLGPGDQGYKRRLADGGEQLVSWSLVPPGARQGGAWLRLGVRRGRAAARGLRADAEARLRSTGGPGGVATAARRPLSRHPPA